MPTDKEIAACYQQLFDHLANEHGLILTESELDEIIRLAQITVANYDSLYSTCCNTVLGEGGYLLKGCQNKKYIKCN